MAPVILIPVGQPEYHQRRVRGSFTGDNGGMFSSFVVNFFDDFLVYVSADSGLEHRGHHPLSRFIAALDEGFLQGRHPEQLLFERPEPDP